MIPAKFDYEVPANLGEALALLKEHGDDAKVLTGGHSLLPMMKLRLAQPAVVVDLRRCTELTGITRENGTLSIGAATTHADIESSDEVRKAVPLLCETAANIGDVQVRNVGTVGGSIVHADPAADWPAAFLATDAVFELRGLDGQRDVAAKDFFIGLLETAARPGEILTRIRVPVTEGTGSYRKLAQSASGFALAGAAVQLQVKDEKIVHANVGITGVADRAYRPQQVENALAGCPIVEDAVAQACAKAADGVDALEDIHASADYRTHLACVLTRRAVLAACGRTV